MFHLLVILSVIASNGYGVMAVTLDASLLTQLGYNNQSTEIYVTSKNIDDIDPNAFKGYTKVTTLGLSYNALTKIDLSVIKDMANNLKYLDFSYNPLTQLTNTKKIIIPYIRLIGLRECPLTSFDSNVMNGLANLNDLIASIAIKPNQLSALKNLNSLTITTKNQTSLTKEHFNGLNSVKWLTFTDSNIKTIEVHTLLAMPNLTYIYLRNNALTSFEYLQIPPKAITMDLSGNKINYFMLSRTIGVLKSLNLKDNLFRSFKSMDFSFLANISYLGLANNPHAYPNEIAGHMKYLVNINQIDISNLSISSIDSNFFKQNTELTYIWSSNNKISVLPYNTFSHLKQLGFLDLSFNQISVLDNRTFLGLEYMSDINLRVNKLTKILPRTFYNLSLLRNLQLSNNLISEIDSSAFTGCYNLKLIDLTYNQLSKISPRTFDNNLTLGYLSMFSNQLTELDNLTFAGVKSINYLDLSYNKISTIGPGTFNSLSITSLVLYSNLLIKIENGTFAGQDQLIHIDLRFNKIDTIESGAFNDLTNLQIIHLEYNNITYLDSSTFYGCNNLVTINLANNPNLVTSNLQSLCPTAAVNCKVIY